MVFNYERNMELFEIRVSLTHSSKRISKSTIHGHVTVAKVPVHSTHSRPVHISTQKEKDVTSE